MKLPKELTTVTPASRGLALFLFFCLPIFGFFFGMRIHQLITPVPPELTNIPIPHAGGSPFFTPVTIPGWKTYTDAGNKFEFQYPQNWHLLPESKTGVALFNVDLNRSDLPPEGMGSGEIKIEILVDDMNKLHPLFPIHYQVTTFAGEPAEVLTGQENDSSNENNKLILFTKGNRIYSVAIYTGVNSESSYAMINQILSTFQLTQ